MHCNLSEIHLNRLNPCDLEEQKHAFTVGALNVLPLLMRDFSNPIYQYSREQDPIIAVSFTGLFDFMVTLFGVGWLHWWEAGRPREWETPIEDYTAVDLRKWRTLIFDLENELHVNEHARPQTMHDAEMFLYLEQLFLRFWKRCVYQKVRSFCKEKGIKRPNRYTTVQPAGCLDKNALRIFDQGLLYADELVEPGSGETTGLDLSVRDGIKATTAIANAPLDLIKITTKGGHSIRMTPDHRLSIQGKWVKAEDMQPGMSLDYSLGEYQKTTEVPLKPVDHDRYTRQYRKNTVGTARGVLAKTIKTPSTTNRDLGYFIGALFGNGCMSKSQHRVRFSHGRLDVLKKISRISYELFGLEGTIIDDENKFELCLASRQLFEWLTDNELGKSLRSKNLNRLPKAIRMASNTTLLAFFAGLIDTDGCPRNGTLSIESASKSFVENLQQIGEALGLCLTMSCNKNDDSFQQKKAMYTLHLSKMLSNMTVCKQLNSMSIKLLERPIQYPSRSFKFNPYEIKSIERTGEDYSYDFAIEGVDDDDSWYWQGAIKSHNTKSLLSGASPGWHPPKAQRFIRRITFGKNDPVALACLDFGYSVVPSQSDIDDQGKLLDDPFDARCTEWLVEIPIEVSWANVTHADEVDLHKFPATAQFDFYMQVQKHYTTHNTSATIEFRENEIEPLAIAVYTAIQKNKGYISAAMLSRWDDYQSFPRLPFEPIDKVTYERLNAEIKVRQKTCNFHEAIMKYDQGYGDEVGPSGCDSDKCLLPLESPK